MKPEASMRHSIRQICLALLFTLAGLSLQAQFPPGATPYTIQQTGTPSPGYLFIGPRSLAVLDEDPSTLMLLDSAGALVWYAIVADDTIPPVFNIVVYDFKPLPNGLLSYWQPKHSGDKFFLLDSTFSIVDSVFCIGIPQTDEHDIVWEPNGNYTLICHDDTVADASNLNTTSGAPGSPFATISYQVIQEQDPSRSTVRSWKLLDHIAIEDSDTAYFTSPSYLDHHHINSMYARGDEMVLSSRNLNEITSFDRNSGQINWRLGGKGNQFTIVGDTLPFKAQHDANFDKNGHLYLFDNGSSGASNVARYVEYQLDTVSMVATLVREHRHPQGLRSRFMGNAVKLPNDNVLVTWAGVYPVDSGASITEFAPNGDLVMELELPENFISYRSHKEPLPFELERIQVSCDPESQQLSAEAGHASYWWNTGERSRSITVQDTGWYQVWASQGIGHMSSKRMHITDLSQLCLQVSGAAAQMERLEVYPNPVAEALRIRMPKSLAQAWTLEVRDVLGRAVWQQEGKAMDLEINVSQWPAGVYLLRMADKQGRVYSGKFSKAPN